MIIRPQAAFCPSPLVEIIRDEIVNTGPIPFARFMALCLYHAEFGYYCAPREKIGPKGDYYTSLSVHPIFATMLGKQMLQMILALQSGDEKMSLIEFGAGEGTLCHGILNFLQKEAPDIFNQVTYIIIETSPSFQAHQKALLLPLYPHTVLWEDQMPKDCVGIVLSNEFIDALPVHRMHIEMDRAGLEPAPTWNEIYVDWKDGKCSEIYNPPSSPALLSYFDRLDIKPKRTFDCEINLAALDWMRGVVQSLKKGFVLTIDYGYPAHQLYHPSRHRGTFLCYYKHTVNENPYNHIGEQDMTSHVDFTALARAGEEAGLSVLGFTDQTHFLMGLGIAQEMQTVADKMNDSDEAQKKFLRMKELMAPQKMGKVFKVLIQGKNIPASVSLDGLTFRAFPNNVLTAS